MIEREGRRGQVTIFIILGILIIAMIALFFIYLNKDAEPDVLPISGEASPASYLSNCIKDQLSNDLQTLSLQGGDFNNPLSIKFKFNDEDYRNISYLCYSEEEAPCEIEQPSILNHLEKELKGSLAETSENCFDHLLQSLEDEGYTTTGEYEGINVDIKENRIVFGVYSKLTYSKESQSENVDEITFEYPSEIYGIGKAVQEIIGDEMERNSFDRFDYIENHPGYEIDYEVPASSTKIYTVKSKITQEEFRFAVKGGYY